MEWNIKWPTKIFHVNRDSDWNKLWASILFYNAITSVVVYSYVYRSALECCLQMIWQDRLSLVLVFEEKMIQPSEKAWYIKIVIVVHQTGS